MIDTWRMLSALGDSRWLLPVAATLLLLPAPSLKPLRWRWALAILGTGTLTALTKLAFLAWGMGISQWSFTGISGHAAMSAVIYPVLLHLAAPHARPASPYSIAGVLLAMLIGYSRLPLGAHSPADVLAGLALGLATSRWVLNGSGAPARASSSHLMCAATAGLIASWLLADHAPHQLVVWLASLLKGNP